MHQILFLWRDQATVPLEFHMLFVFHFQCCNSNFLGNQSPSLRISRALEGQKTASGEMVWTIYTMFSCVWWIYHLGGRKSYLYSVVPTRTSWMVLEGKMLTYICTLSRHLKSEKHFNYKIWRLLLQPWIYGLISFQTQNGTPLPTTMNIWSCLIPTTKWDGLSYNHEYKALFHSFFLKSAVFYL